MAVVQFLLGFHGDGLSGRGGCGVVQFHPYRTGSPVLPACKFHTAVVLPYCTPPSRRPRIPASSFLFLPDFTRNEGLKESARLCRLAIPYYRRATRAIPGRDSFVMVIIRNSSVRKRAERSEKKKSSLLNY